ncbi:LamB/YcsF family protein [Streptomyces sp. NBC_01618]|uniref:LamB/YcsF family protein n=1 Tax=Streptomyces sp. NBC_01618 TaxID=2975900 RepID=UPI003870694A|nr:LamB/YcsF family protein [Streptomyces sp. NBC_01618]
MAQVALTTDIGEGYGRWELADDEALLDVVTAANIACGFHGGDPGIMRRTCKLSVANDVAIGAQVSYRDLHGFGRRFIACGRQELTDDLLYQMGALEVFARTAGDKISYIRAHGALYNAAATVTEHAQAIVDATREYNADLPLLAQVGTETWRLGQEAGLNMVAEAFVDRAYTPQGLLVPRTEPDAMLSDPAQASARAVEMVTQGEITAIDGSRIPIRAEAILVHCDTAGSVEIARATRKALEAADVDLVRIG